VAILVKQINIERKANFLIFSHPYALDSGKACRNDATFICVDTYALKAGFSTIKRLDANSSIEIISREPRLY
jgi:hypothetical protein